MDKQLLRKMRAATKKAEQNAKKRDFEKGKKQEPVNMDLVNKEAEKADEQRLQLVPKRDVSKVPFSQLIDENYNYLREKGYLERAERLLILDLMPFCELGGNGIINSTGRYLTVSDIAEITGLTRQRISPLINSLIDKGILIEYLESRHKRQLKKTGKINNERALFFNPEIVIKTNKNKINNTLCRMLINDDVLESNGIKLPRKIWIKQGAEFGKLFTRKHYLRLKKQNEKGTCEK